MENNANPNVCNKYSYWTPIHWAARYGEVENVEELLKPRYLNRRAYEYYPDKKGFFPIDYAGFFENKEVVFLLIV